MTDTEEPTEMSDEDKTKLRAFLKVEYDRIVELTGTIEATCPVCTAARQIYGCTGSSPRRCNRLCPAAERCTKYMEVRNAYLGTLVSLRYEVFGACMKLDYDPHGPVIDL